MAGLAGTEEGTWVGRCGAGEFGWLEPLCVAHTHTHLPAQSTRGMMVKGTAGLLASSSRAVRKHSVAAASLP